MDNKEKRFSIYRHVDTNTQEGKLSGKTKVLVLFKAYKFHAFLIDIIYLTG